MLFNRIVTFSAVRRAFVGLVAAVVIAGAPGAMADPPTKTEPTTGTANPRVEMVIEGRGKILIELFPSAAPKTVKHLTELVNKKFYDGLLFHRVAKDFVAQAGDPKSRGVDGSKLRDLSDHDVYQQFALGNGGSGKTVPLEAKLPHERGTLGLARGDDLDSGDSQFFFNLKANHFLDSAYCVFGKVIKGADVMDSIKQGDRIKTMRMVKAPK